MEDLRAQVNEVRLLALTSLQNCILPIKCHCVTGVRSASSHVTPEAVALLSFAGRSKLFSVCGNALNWRAHASQPSACVWRLILTRFAPTPRSTPATLLQQLGDKFLLFLNPDFYADRPTKDWPLAHFVSRSADACHVGGGWRVREDAGGALLPCIRTTAASRWPEMLSATGLSMRAHVAHSLRCYATGLAGGVTWAWVTRQVVPTHKNDKRSNLSGRFELHTRVALCAPIRARFIAPPERSACAFSSLRAQPASTASAERCLRPR